MVLAEPPQEDDFGAWDLLVSARTDMEGWQYGSVFKCAAVPLSQKIDCIASWLKSSTMVLQKLPQVISHRSRTKLWVAVSSPSSTHAAGPLQFDDKQRC